VFDEVLELLKDTLKGAFTRDSVKELKEKLLKEFEKNKNLTIR
jgi:hypothetical protein